MKNAVLILLITALLSTGCLDKKENSKMANPKPRENPENKHLQTATFAAGCFWGVQSTFDEIKGVKKTTVGYTGGHTQAPTYREVCAGNTGHAEAIQIIYDPNQVTYEKLLEVFFSNHNPTTKNRQGPDIGSQYRSAIFYHNPEQKQLAEKTKQQLNNSAKFRNPVVTEITKASEFYPAEEYHQKYLEKKGIKACH